MAIVFEDECIGCPPGMGCLGSACPNKKVKHYYCDKCEQEFEPEELFIDEDDKELCDECLLSKYDTVAQREEGVRWKV